MKKITILLFLLALVAGGCTQSGGGAPMMAATTVEGQPTESQLTESDSLEGQNPDGELAEGQPAEGGLAEGEYVEGFATVKIRSYPNGTRKATFETSLIPPSQLFGESVSDWNQVSKIGFTVNGGQEIMADMKTFPIEVELGSNTGNLNIVAVLVDGGKKVQGNLN